MEHKQGTLSERLLSAYKQSGIFLVTSFIYGIIAVVVFIIGFLVGQDAIIGLFTGSSTAGVQLIIGILLLVVGYLLFFVGFFAAFIFSATRGVSSTRPLGFGEAYVTTFQLILELAVALAFAMVLLIIGGSIGGAIGVLFSIIGFILLLFFPYASLFYVVDFLGSR